MQDASISPTANAAKVIGLLWQSVAMHCCAEAEHLFGEVVTFLLMAMHKCVSVAY
jgi:hypothetical protein